jgi:hypothetical protein
VTEHFLSLADHPAGRLGWLLGVAAEVKEAPAGYVDALRGHFRLHVHKVLMLFMMDAI